MNPTEGHRGVAPQKSIGARLPAYRRTSAKLLSAKESNYQ